jgi:HNH endonuclease
LLTQERLCALLEYSPDTGEWHWRVDHGSKIKAGMKAGHTDKRGYVWIGIDGVVYLAHRLAHLYMTGEWPPYLIDHENTDKGANWWDNLRPASNEQNLGNRGKAKNNTSGFKNVYFRKDNRRHPWVVQVKRGARIHRSFHATIQGAADAAIIARQDLFGEFARG